MNKAIVTGANGFVGSALCAELSGKGIEVFAVVRGEDSDVSKIRNLNNVNLIICDLSNINELPDIVGERDIDVFYHLAWEGTSGPMRRDEKIQLSNIISCCMAVRTSKMLGCKRFVYASSIMEYEIMDVMKKNLDPVSNEIYSMAKLCADCMGKAIAKDLGVEYISGLISNIYGPGEFSPRLINTSLRKLLKKEHCSFSSGMQMYDFIYIDDAAKAFYSIGEKGLAGKTYYIGSFNPQPLKEYLISMRNQVDPSIELGLGELSTRAISLPFNEFDLYAVKNDTGYEPRISFEEGIRRTIAWLKEMGL